MIAFAIGTELSFRVVFVANGNRKPPIINKEINYSVLFTLIIVTAVVLCINSIPVIKSLLAGMTLYDIASEGDIIRENDSVGLMVGIVYIIVQPVTAMISPIVASEIFKPDVKYKRTLVFANIVIVLLHTLQHGGRDMIIVFCISYFFGYLFYRKKKFGKIKKSSKLAIIFLLSVVLIFGIWISASRGIEDLGDSLYYYFSGAVPHLQTCIQEIEFEDMTWGMGLLYGLLSPVLLGLRGVGLIRGYPNIIDQVVENMEIPTHINPIGEGVTINAHVGLSYYFYADGGILFVLFGCLLFGYLACMAFQKARKHRDSQNVAIYLMMLCVILMSFIRFQLVSSKYALAMLYMATFIYTKRSITHDCTEFKGWIR